MLGWLFLPESNPIEGTSNLITLDGLPDLDKRSIIILVTSLLLIIKEFSGKVFREKFKFRILDTIIVVYLLSTFATNYYVGNEFKEPFSDFRHRSISLGIPYLIGRIYFSNIRFHLVLAKKTLYFLLLYVPLFLYEFRLSPQIHNLVYGYQQLGSFTQSARNLGWRPTVFLRHGLELSLALSFAGIVGFWLVRSRVLSKGFEIIGVFLIFICLFLSQSYGAILILAVSISVLLVCRYIKIGFALILLFLLPTFYISSKISGFKIEEPIIETARGFLPQRRFQSLSYRLEQESYLLDSLKDHKILGKSRTLSLKNLAKKVVRDSRWIIEYSDGGLLSLIPFFSILTLPIFGLYRLAPASLWHTKRYCSTAALAVGIGMLSWDLLINNFISSVHFLILGGLVYPINIKKKYYYIVK